MIVRRIAPKNEGQKLKVAAYCRVSTDMSSQEGSLENQRTVYESMIRANPDWVFAGLYADEGRSGVTDKREGFQRMIADARAGKIDRILTKSISRFARDVILCRQYVEELLELNVSVYFEREGIDTLDPCTLMVLSLGAAIAQDESRANSENHRWSYRRRVELGRYKIWNNWVLGYDADENGKPVPNKDAWIIRMAFEMYADGKELWEIEEALKNEGVVGPRNGKPLHQNNIRYILRNEIYVGDRLLQKKPPMDMLTKKPDPRWKHVSNYLKDDHEGIVSRELWNAVQSRFALNGGRTIRKKNSRDKALMA